MKKTIALAIVFTCMFLVGCELISSAYAEPAIVTPTVIGPIESRDRAVKIHILRDPTRRINCYIPTTAYATTPSCISYSKRPSSRSPSIIGPYHTGVGLNKVQMYIFLDSAFGNACYIPNSRGANTPNCLRIR